MKYVLDLKDYVTKLDSTEKDYNELFYRYLIQDDDHTTHANVWFSQKVDSKNIYSVSVALTDMYENKYHIYIHCYDGVYFPSNFEIEVNRRIFTNADEIWEHQKRLNEIWDIAKTIMTIFLEKEHRKVKP